MKSGLKHTILLCFLIFVATLCVFSACKNKCADGHTWELASTTATCYDGGIETYECKNCKEIKTENVEAYGHSFVLSSRTEPTCKTNGEEVKKCSRCGFESHQPLLIVDHDYQVKSTTPSTCTVKGSQLLECSMCHETKTESLELKEHEYELINTITSTCLTAGSAQYKCTKCQHIKLASSTMLLSHTFVDGFCTNCGLSECYFSPNLNVRWQFGTLLGDLTPLFNNDNQDTVEHRNSHIINIKLICYDQSTAYTFSYDSKTNIDNVFFSAADGVENMDIPCHFMIKIGNLKNYLKTYTIEISCDGFKTITNSYTYR